MNRASWRSLDGLRGLSIISVVAVHLWAHASKESRGIPIGLLLGTTPIDLTWIFATGHNAVVIFFVLSGFLLYRHWLDEAMPEINFSKKIGVFFRKRARRIFPSWLFFTSVYLLLTVMVGRHRFASELSLSNILANITFISPIADFFQNPEKIATSLDLLPGTWSLNPEIWFYAVMPFLAWMLHRFGLASRGLLLLSSTGLLSRMWMGDHPSFTLIHSLPGVVDAFLLGMFVASASVNNAISKTAGWFFPIGVIYYIALCSGHISPGPDYQFQLAVSSAMMVAGLVAPGERDWSKFLTWPWLVHIGKISFSIFLCNLLIAWHIVLPFSQWAGVRTDAMRFVWNICLGVPLILLMSHFTFHWIEHPFMLKPAIARLLLVRRAVVLAALFVGVAVIASTGAYSQLNRNAEFQSTIIRWLVESPVGLISATMPSNRHLLSTDSATKSAVVNAERDDHGTIRVSSPGVSNANAWVNVTLPIDTQTVRRGVPLTISATLVVEQASDLQICLGVFDGEIDICTEKEMLSAASSLLTVTAIPKSVGTLQFKLNLFPGPTASPFAFQLKGLALTTAAIKSVPR